MAARSSDLAAAVVAELIAAPVLTFGQQLEPVRVYAPSWTLEQLDKLRVSVAALEEDSVLSGRDGTQKDLKVGVCVQKRVSDPNSLDLIDPLVLLCDQIQDYFETSAAGEPTGRQLAAVPAASWILSERQPLFDLGLLREQHHFLAVITFTYRFL